MRRGVAAQRMPPGLDTRYVGVGLWQVGGCPPRRWGTPLCCISPGRTKLSTNSKTDHADRTTQWPSRRRPASPGHQIPTPGTKMRPAPTSGAGLLRATLPGGCSASVTPVPCAILARMYDCCQAQDGDLQRLRIPRHRWQSCQTVGVLLLRVLRARRRDSCRSDAGPQ
jgi:hypothetical protein